MGGPDGQRDDSDHSWVTATYVCAVLTYLLIKGFENQQVKISGGHEVIREGPRVSAEPRAGNRELSHRVQRG